jgi:hypothetical protein
MVSRLRSNYYLHWKGCPDFAPGKILCPAKAFPPSRRKKRPSTQCAHLRQKVRKSAEMKNSLIKVNGRTENIFCEKRHKILKNRWF